MMLQTLSVAQGGLPCGSDEDARRKMQTTPVRETNVGLAQA